MSNSKNTSSKKQGKSSATDDYKYTPGTDRPKSNVEDKRPSSGNVRGV